MRILRILHAGSYPLAVAIAMIGLGGGCDSGSDSSATSTIKVDPKETQDRQKMLEGMYKSAGKGAAPKAAAPTAPAPTSTSK